LRERCSPQLEMSASLNLLPTKTRL
jgi:hypothetical protein